MGNLSHTRSPDNTIHWQILIFANNVRLGELQFKSIARPLVGKPVNYCFKQRRVVDHQPEP